LVKHGGYSFDDVKNKMTVYERKKHFNRLIKEFEQQKKLAEKK
jgi:hypothetical protein